MICNVHVTHTEQQSLVYPMARLEFVVVFASAIPASPPQSH